MKKMYVFLILLILLLPSIFTATAADEGAESNQSMTDQKVMTISQAVVLGIVEGFTEYLPVSSTGHLLLAEKIMGIGEDSHQSPAQRERTREGADAYTICIQAGAILAVLWLYFGRVIQIFQGLTGNNPDGRRLLINVSVGFLPAAALGLLFNKIIKAYLFGPWPVVFAWFVGGVAILVVSRRNRSRGKSSGSSIILDEMTWKMALVIGFAQCIAMWPGVSRSLVTIVGGLLVGLSIEAAVEYSFLLGVVTLSAATAYDTLKHGRLMLETFDQNALIVGVLVAFVAAFISVKWMVSYLSRNGLEIFGYYRVVIAIATSLFLISSNMIKI